MRYVWITVTGVVPSLRAMCMCLKRAHRQR